MPVVKEEKSQADRIKECITILKKLTDEVGVEADNPSIVVLKRRMGHYWRDGKLQEDTLPLYGYNRVIIYKFPKWAHQDVEVTLRVNNLRNQPLPQDLMEELAAQTNSVSQSAPSHPSQQATEEK
jgi:hypothetical protein